ncbi:hypothetical protein NQ314_015334 [Rhamnusium bicolor]|uniref:CCHC-type domain-containing protein n=1 Tax=Rhamnusium bicolor TaxID=1586634 RepID=A0AAV8WZL7_9CUCU|nr:hypothetical protein NQ314_015334 [Rhamnusium bicolor]
MDTEEGPIVVSEEAQLTSRDQFWCSGCGSRGHLEHECNYYDREFPPTTPFIVNYEDILYQHNPNRLAQDTATFPPPSTVTSEEHNAVSYPYFENRPSTSQSTSMGNTHLSHSSHSSAVPPLMSLNIPAPLNSPSAERTVVPSDRNLVIDMPNSTPSSTKVLNPFSVFANRGMNNALKKQNIHSQRLYTNKLCKNDERKNRHIIMSMSCNVVRQFLKKSIEELDTVATKYDPRLLRKKLYKYANCALSKRPLTEELVREKCFWYRVFNMFIFGVHKFRDGNLHVNYLRKYLSESKQNKLDENKRKSLFSAYNYIFGRDCHVNVNYSKIIRQIIQRCDEVGVY